LSHVQETSLDVYYQKVLPKLRQKQRQVMQVFLDNPHCDYTNMEAAVILRWSINRVTPRVLELRDQGLLVQSCRRRCKITRNMANAWRLQF